MAEKFEFRLHIEGPETSQVLLVPVGTTTIGRQAGSDLQLNLAQVSRRHAQLDCTSSECQITDLGSANGTTVNGEKLTPHVPVLLPPNATIKIGPFELTLEKSPVEAPQVEEPPPPVELAREPEPVAEPSFEVMEWAAAPPPPAAPPPSKPPPEPGPVGESLVPPGLSTHSRRLLSYLPGIYQTDFMARFLGIFESILIPIEWNVDNFDLYLDPGTVPTGFLPWLANWFEITFDPTWSEAQRRTLLAEAHQIYARRGTCWALSRVLEIYTGHRPEIIDLGEDLEPFTFAVQLPLRAGEVNRELVERIIDANKPAHTTYTLKILREK
jgi:phage tail-like protein